MSKEKNFEGSPLQLQDGIKYIGDKGPVFGARYVQVVMIALGVSLSFATKSVFSVAIVAMTDDTTSSNPDIPTYNWNNKSVIISAILWSSLIMNLPAGYLGKRFGPKWFVTGASVFNATFFMLIPVFAQIAGSAGVMFCRICQGLALGFMFPSNAVIMGRWAPPEERSRMGFIGSASMLIFMMISSVTTGFIAESPLGWPWVFYLFGALELVWVVFFIFLAKQNVQDHKTISAEEKKYLETTLFKLEKDGKTPWKQIITAMPVWAVIVGGSGFTWAIAILSTEMSIFLSKVMKFDLSANGIVSSVPSLAGLICGVGIAILSDILPKRGLLSVLNTRRLFQLVGITGTTLPLVFMAFIPVDYKVWTIVFLCISNVFINTTVIGGSHINLLDIAPKYAGVIMGFSQTIADSLSIFAPLTVQWICTDETDAMQWATVFGISAVISISTAIFFAIFASDKRQIWETESEEEATIEAQLKRGSIISFPHGVIF